MEGDSPSLIDGYTGAAVLLNARSTFTRVSFSSDSRTSCGPWLVSSSWVHFGPFGRARSRHTRPHREGFLKEQLSPCCGTRRPRRVVLTRIQKDGFPPQRFRRDRPVARFPEHSPRSDPYGFPLALSRGAFASKLAPRAVATKLAVLPTASSRVSP